LTYCGAHPSVEASISNITKGNLSLFGVIDVLVSVVGALALTVDENG
jgi:hypothetical protein